MAQARGTGGYQNAEALGALLARTLTFAVASVALGPGTGGEQLFTVVGLKTTDVPIAISNATAADTAGLNIYVARVSAASQVALNVFNETTAAIAAVSGLRTLVWYRR